MEDCMRIWSIHPKYLDWKGLGAQWREALLAQKVLQGETKGWRNHPQLNRFKEHPEPLKAVGYYLVQIHIESQKRDYNYNYSHRQPVMSDNLTFIHYASQRCVQRSQPISVPVLDTLYQYIKILEPAESVEKIPINQ